MAYFAVYLGYLFMTTESELAHWVPLVLLPWILLWALGRRREPGLRLRTWGAASAWRGLPEAGDPTPGEDALRALVARVLPPRPLPRRVAPRR